MQTTASLFDLTGGENVVKMAAAEFSKPSAYDVQELIKSQVLDLISTIDGGIEPQAVYELLKSKGTVNKEKYSSDYNFLQAINFLASLNMMCRDENGRMFRLDDPKFEKRRIICEAISKHSSGGACFDGRIESIKLIPRDQTTGPNPLHPLTVRMGPDQNSYLYSCSGPVPCSLDQQFWSALVHLVRCP